MKWFIICVIAFMVMPAAHAEVLLLKNGDTIEGTVIEETNDYVLLQMDGFMMTYYKDEIEQMVATWSDLPQLEGQESQDYLAEFDNAVYAVEEEVKRAQDPTGVTEDFEEDTVQLTETERQLIDDMEKQDLILQFMDVFGTRATLKASYQQMLEQLTPEQIEQVSNAVTVESITEQLVPLYDRRFTSEELRKYITFYRSREGRKLLRTIPLLMKDSVDVSMQYLQRHLPNTAQKPNI